MMRENRAGQAQQQENDRTVLPLHGRGSAARLRLLVACDRILIGGVADDLHIPHGLRGDGEPLVREWATPELPRRESIGLMRAPSRYFGRPLNPWAVISIR